MVVAAQAAFAQTNAGQLTEALLDAVRPIAADPSAIAEIKARLQKGAVPLGNDNIEPRLEGDGASPADTGKASSTAPTAAQLEELDALAREVERMARQLAEAESKLAELERQLRSSESNQSAGSTRASPVSTAVSAEDAEFFKTRVLPILSANCFKCHGPEKQKSELRLDSLDALLRGGSRGPAAVAGSPSESLFIKAIRYDDTDLKMPPDNKLPDEAIQALTEWVARGLSWPENAQAAPIDKTALIDSDERYWAFRPVQNAVVPTASRPNWVANPIDAFILAKLDGNGLSPSPAADRRTLIRRLHLNLHGLPPTPDEVDAFEDDPDPNAYENLVDRALASHRYGERWARHWLDIVRFAETNGFETNTPRKNAWPYRDYVIQALNEDRPYTQFIRDQLAGDAFGADAATGFLVAGASDEVKSPDIVLTKNQRDTELHDMVSATAAAFLGVTLGCAKCHDHKFDPISQRDYYALRAMFEGVQHGERELPVPDRETRLARAQDIRAELAIVERRLYRFEPLADVRPQTLERLHIDTAGLDLSNFDPTGHRAKISPRGNVDRFAPVAARAVRINVYRTNGLEPCIDEIEIFTADAEPRNVALASAGAAASASGEFVGSDKHKIAHLNDGRYGNDYSWIPAANGHQWAQIDLATTETIDTVVWARDREGKFSDRLPVHYTLEAASENNVWTVVASSADRIPQGAPANNETRRETTQRTGLDSFKPPTDPGSLEALKQTKSEIEKELKELLNFPKVYAGRFEEPGQTFILRRGDPMQPAEAVAPATPEHLGPRCEMPPETPEQQRRLKLAEWIASEQNPLTARVIVNRVWHYHFGTGLVASPSDFGAMGARPTHPELLDWLAREFIKNGWSLKKLHRLILLSNTYRQSSAPNPAALAIDADSRLLWRFPPRRLETEPIRDSILFVSGQLNPARGGPGFDVFKPNDNYVHVYVPKERFGPDEFRRMIYQWKPRMEQDVTFGIFDCPDASQTMPKRNVSTSPLQALSLLNSPFMIQQSRCFAERVRAEAGPDRSEQAKVAFSLAFNRFPQPDELSAAVNLIGNSGLDMLCRALYNANEFLYLN